MSKQFNLVLACGCALVRLAAASAWQDNLENSIPLEAWGSASCLASGGSDEECDLHLLQLRAQELAGAVAGASEASDRGAHAMYTSTGADQSLEGGDVAEDAHGAAARASSVQNASASAAGQCTSHDLEMMNKLGGGNAPGSWPGVIAYCARRSFRWLKIHYDELTRCVSERTGVRLECASCFGNVGGKYGYDNCKAQCIVGKWCSRRCLTCTRRGAEVVETCAGLVAPGDAFC